MKLVLHTSLSHQTESLWHCATILTFANDILLSATGKMINSQRPIPRTVESETPDLSMCSVNLEAWLKDRGT